MADSNETTQNPSIVIDLDAWIQEAQSRAVEYQGLEEAQFFLTEARRYLVMKTYLSRIADKLDSIEKRLLTIQDQVQGQEQEKI